MVGCVTFWVVILFQDNEHFANNYFSNILFIWGLCKTVGRMQKLFMLFLGHLEDLPFNVSLLTLGLIQVKEFHGFSNTNSYWQCDGMDGWYSLVTVPYGLLIWRPDQDGKWNIESQGDGYRSLALLGFTPHYLSCQNIMGERSKTNDENKQETKKAFDSLK